MDQQAERNKAIQLYGAGEIDEARMLLSKYCPANPYDIEAGLCWGLTEARQDAFDKAERIFRQVIKSDANSIPGHYYLGHSLEAQQETGEAEVHYRKVLELQPAHEQAHVSLVNLYKLQGNIDAAEQAYRQALAVIPGLSGRMQSPADSAASEKVFTPLRQNMQAALNQLRSLDYYPDLVIDVGTADGTAPLLKVFPKSRFLWIEPLEEFSGTLKKLESAYNGSFMIIAAGKADGEITLNVHPDLFGSSVLNETDGKIADGTERVVQVRRLDGLVETSADSGMKVLLKVDVQGAELDVIEGSAGILDRVDVVILEVSFFKFQEGNPGFYEVVVYMKEKGFVVYDLFDGHNRPLDQALAQKDIMFVKEDGFFRKSHRWATVEQREMFNKKSQT